MKRTCVTVLLVFLTAVASAQKPESADPLTRMKQIFGLAAADLSGKNHRVVFAAEDNVESLNLRRWIVTVQTYPADYKEDVMPVMFSGPPCPFGKHDEFCSIRDIAGEPLFIGRFDIDYRGRILRFVGNVVVTASRMQAFEKQLMAHQQWTQTEISVALASAGAKFGPDKEKEFRATLPEALKKLERAFGPLRVHRVSSLKPVFFRPPGKEPHLIAWPAYWSVSIILLRNPRERLVMSFEPFEGQLQSLYVSRGSMVLDPKTHKPKWMPPDD